MPAIQQTIDKRGVATVTLNRPDKHNAFDDVIIKALTDTLLALGDNPDVRIVVLAGAGKSFSAGADLNWMQRMAAYDYDDNLKDANALATLLKTLNTLPRPTIARVQGAAFGGAVGLVACCDMAVGSERASFALSEVRIGLIPATISPYVIRAIGPRAARRYFLSAERFDATEAKQLGLLSRVVNESELDQAMEDCIATLLANSPAAMREAKQLVEDFSERPIDDALIADSSERIAAIRVSAEGQEGLKAFLEKRTPTWI